MKRILLFLIILLSYGCTHSGKSDAPEKDMHVRFKFSKPKPKPVPVTIPPAPPAPQKNETKNSEQSDNVESRLDYMEATNASHWRKTESRNPSFAEKSIKYEKIKIASPVCEGTPAVAEKIENTSEEGKITYDIPDTMQVGKQFNIRVRITRRVDYSSTAFLPKPNSPSIVIRTSGTMEVKIVDPSADGDKAFNIIKNDTDVQIVDSSDYTEWIFAITPMKSGKFPIDIIVSIIKDGNRKDKSYVGEVWVKANNKVALKTFWQKYWQWCFTTLIIPLITWWWKNRKEKKEK